ncbi:MAG: hypothetical protein MHMPM18_000309 [Marteilia pararefringens]
MMMLSQRTAAVRNFLISLRNGTRFSGGGEYVASSRRFFASDESPIDAIRNLTNKYDLLLFMKGNREKPMCGYSSNACRILDAIDAKYHTYDILSDLSIREHLKIYSNFPTFPQLYSHGELIGGFDIIYDLFLSHKLEKELGMTEKNSSKHKT